MTWLGSSRTGLAAMTRAAAPDTSGAENEVPFPPCSPFSAQGE